MVFKRLDMDAYERREHFDFFRAMAYPYCGTTANVDITRFREVQKATGRPFFLTMLYCAARAANSVTELRRRIDGDGIIEFDRCDTSHTVLKENGTFAFCRLTCDGSLDEFIACGLAEQQRVLQEGDIDDGDEAISLFFVSSIPWMSYTSLTQALPSPADSNPRITWGRFFEQGDRLLLPVTLLVNHSLADGKHIADFYAALEQELAAIQ